MKRFKNTMLVSLYILLVALLFSGAYVVGKTSMGSKPAPKEVYKDEESVEVVSNQEPKIPEYEVVAEDGKIIIYKCIGDIRSVVASEEISESVFPKEDIEELRKGVRFERLESAQHLFENFVS